MEPLQLNKGTKDPFKQFEHLYTGLSLKVGGFPLATTSVAPCYFYWKIGEN